jgi:hypothetical protein
MPFASERGTGVERIAEELKKQRWETCWGHVATEECPNELFVKEEEKKRSLGFWEAFHL